MTYKQFMQCNIDLSPLGIMQREDTTPYFCTPKRARIIGWAGVDGIHYCFAHRFGEIIFAVSPMNGPKEWVHPIAHSFGDFLRLLIACGDAAALEQAWAWDKAQFDAFLAENPPTHEQANTIEALEQTCHLSPMEHPFACIKELQDGFDYSRIQYTDDYDDFAPSEPVLPVWKVYFEGGFWSEREISRAGTEIPVQSKFLWDGREVLVPSVYSCAKGLVVDVCIKIPAKDIRAFMDKWNLSPKNDGSDFTEEQQMQAEAESPMAISFSPEVTVNGKVLRTSHGSGLSWNPCTSDANCLEAKGAIEHYGLDPSSGWVVSRHAFPWATARRPKEIKALSLTLAVDPVRLPGSKFEGDTPGVQIAFIHPINGKKHTLTILECEKQEMPEHAFRDEGFDFPTHYTAMSYTMVPELPEGAFSVMDTVQGDRPRKKQADPNAPTADCVAMSVGIIGGADGPTAVFIGSKPRAACSSLHFSPEYDVQWQMIFHEKMQSDITSTLI